MLFQNREFVRPYIEMLFFFCQQNSCAITLLNDPDLIAKQHDATRWTYIHFQPSVLNFRRYFYSWLTSINLSVLLIRNSVTGSRDPLRVLKSDTRSQCESDGLRMSFIYKESV